MVSIFSSCSSVVATVVGPCLFFLVGCGDWVAAEDKACTLGCVGGVASWAEVCPLSVGRGEDETDPGVGVPGVAGLESSPGGLVSSKLGSTDVPSL